MDKNTILAIVLSTLVIVVAFVLQPILFPQLRRGKNDVNAENAIEVTENTDNSTDSSESIFGEGFETSKFEAETGTEENFEEKTFTVTTDLAQIVLTSKGGDIISYELINHLDTDTGKGIQISDNVSDINRTCALSFGNVDSKIINDVFDCKKIDDYTYLFTKKFTKDGKVFTLGKRYTFMPGEYVFKLDVMIHSDDDLNFDSAAPIYTIRTSPQIGPHFDSKQNRYENRQFVAYNGSKYKRQILGNNQFKKYDKDFIWAGIGGKYFVELVIPENPEIINAGYYSTKVEVNNYQNAQAYIERASTSGKDISDTYYMYFGPRNNKDLKRYNTAETNGWGFGGKKLTECIQTSGLLNWLEVILKYFMELLYKVIPNWGVSIIIMTVILKILMFPLSKKQSMGTLKMQKLQPQMQALQSKYKDDQQRLQIETQKLYKEAGYNPASGCLPMLFQFLVLFAMYNLFNNYFEFRGAMFIPGWIPDLSAGDSVFTFKFNIPLIGNHLRILPIIYVAVQILNGVVTQFGGMAGGNGQSQATMKFMTYGMPIMFFFLFYNAPAGLLLYWTISSVLQIGQQLVINSMMKKKKAEMQIEDNNPNKKLPPKAKKAMEKRNTNKSALKQAKARAKANSAKKL